jgi:hypothetical protein
MTFDDDEIERIYRMGEEAHRKLMPHLKSQREVFSYGYMVGFADALRKGLPDTDKIKSLHLVKPAPRI